MIKLQVMVCALLLAATATFGASQFFEKGEQLFVQNKPKDAQPLLESALNDDPSNEKIYLYLGIIYQQLGDFRRAIDILKRGLDTASTYKDLYYYNMGNDFFSRKEYAFAEEMYSSALSTNTNLAEGHLNRANARLALENFAGALSDYTVFLQLRPQDPQRSNIEKIMALIRQAQDDTEKAHLAELARQQALLKDAQNGLSNAGDNTTNLSVDTIKGQTDPVNVDIKD
jgi:tetratricopeptide (TPR) repeat protein